MTLVEIEQKLVALIARFDGCAIPAYQLQLFKEDVLAGEPVIALEDFCSQLHEYNVPVSKAVRDELRDLGVLLNITPEHWTNLIVE